MQDIRTRVTATKLFLFGLPTACGTIDCMALIPSLRHTWVSAPRVETVENSHKPLELFSMGPSGKGCDAGRAGMRQRCPLSPYLTKTLLTALVHDADQDIIAIPTATGC